MGGRWFGKVCHTAQRIPQSLELNPNLILTLTLILSLKLTLILTLALILTPTCDRSFERWEISVLVGFS